MDTKRSSTWRNPSNKPSLLPEVSHGVRFLIVKLDDWFGLRYRYSALLQVNEPRPSNHPLIAQALGNSVVEKKKLSFKVADGNHCSRLAV